MLYFFKKTVDFAKTMMYNYGSTYNTLEAAMFLELTNNNGRKYIRLVESKKVFDQTKNKRVPRKKTLLNLGFLSNLDNGDPNYFEKLKASFKQGTPLIKELEPFVEKGNKKEVYELRITEGTDNCIGHPKIIANTIIDKILDEIDLSQFIRTYKQHYGITYDVYNFIRLMILGRILKPCSKISTTAQNEDYYTPILKDGYYKYNIYDTLSFVNKHRHAIYNRINTKMKEKFKRTTRYLFYDVTNFFFDIDKEDEDIVNDEGITEAGLRKVGVSKERRKTPIVQMSLIMDEQGIPISIEQFPGNTLDQLTVSKTFENSVNDIQKSRFVFVGDKGFYKGPNIGYLITNNKGYIVSKSVRGCNNKEKDWILEQKDYIYKNPEFKYKSRITAQLRYLPDGTEIEVNEKQVTYWSKKYFDLQFAEKRSFYETIEKILNNPTSLKLSKTQKSDLSKYVKKEYINNKTGEVINSGNIIGLLDIDKVQREWDLLGYYTITTSETGMNDLDIINKYHELVRIEDQFKIMKSSLETRPIFVRTPEHILSHLDICTISLIVVRLIQRQIKLKYPENDFNVFYEGLSAERIVSALNKFQVEKIDDTYYRFNNIDDPDLKKILSSFGVELPLKLFKLGELRQLKNKYKMST